MYVEKQTKAVSNNVGESVGVGYGKAQNVENEDKNVMNELEYDLQKARLTDSSGIGLGSTATIDNLRKE